MIGVPARSSFTRWYTRWPRQGSQDRPFSEASAAGLGCDHRRMRVIDWIKVLLGRRANSSALTSPDPNGPFCKDCGEPRPAKFVGKPLEERDPCPKCGGKSFNFNRCFTATATASASVSWSMKPGDQKNDWAKRWTTLEADLPKVTGLRPGSAGREAIKSAEREVLEFIVSAYHLKDILKADKVLPPGVDVEKTVSADADLALLADMANLDKHHALNSKKHPPRSGYVPKYLEHEAYSSQGGWGLVSKYEHNGVTINAVDVARNGMAAWRTLLQSHGLI